MKFTKEYLEEYFAYDPIDGILTWKKLTKKSRVLVGDHAGKVDFEGYLTVCLDAVVLRVHRVIWIMATGEIPNQIDHINGIRHDNRWENLRSVTNQENARNQKLRITNTSGHIGVSWHKRFGKWHAGVRVDGVRINLGLFANKQDAISARKAAEARYGFHKNHGAVKPHYEHT